MTSPTTVGYSYIREEGDGRSGQYPGFSGKVNKGGPMCLISTTGTTREEVYLDGQRDRQGAGRMEECARAALLAKHEVQKASETLENLAQSHAIIARHAAVIGWATAACSGCIWAIRPIITVPRRIARRWA